MVFSCKRNVILPAMVLLIAGCQREIYEPTEPPVDREVWVLTTKSIEGFQTAAGHVAYTTRAAYYYDTVARTLTYRDTSDNQATSEYKYFYDTNGRLVQVDKNLATGSAEYQTEISYNSDSLISKIVYNDYIGIHEGTFQWSRQGTNYFGQYTDPSITSSPYTDGKRSFLLNDKKQLIEQVNMSTDAAYADIVLKATLDGNGSAILTKSYNRKGNTLDILDSVVYTRENTYPARLSTFHSLWGRGIEWFSNDYFISFLIPPVWETEYYVYINSLTNMRTHYMPDASQVGNNPPLKYGYDDKYVTEYDADKNPVKHTIFMQGEKIAEVKFTWQKIKWIH